MKMFEKRKLILDIYNIWYYLLAIIILIYILTYKL